MRAIVSRAPSISALYLFGSRAHNTGSFRSDIDLLPVTSCPLRQAEIAPWLNSEFNPVDLFETTDGRTARSLMNGSGTYSVDGDLLTQLQAIKLWSAVEGFNEEFTRWDQFALREMNFAMTVFPLAPNVVELARNYQRRLSDEGYPTVFLGSEWGQIGESLSHVVNLALDTPKRLGGRAKIFARDTLRIRTEYDFQNLIHLVLRPWLPSIETENVTVRYLEQEKVADFGLERNTVIIEAKHIRDDNDKRAVLKDLEGLKDFYLRNPNVQLLLFWILVEPDVSFNSALVQRDFSNISRSPVVLVRCFTNPLVAER